VNYSLSLPPLPTSFREMTKTQLKEYRDWFLDVIPTRIAMLTSRVQRGPGLENWTPTYAPSSLGPLGKWLTDNVTTRPRSNTEIAEANAKVPFIDVPTFVLSEDTVSLAMDVGMYLGETILHEHRNYSWQQTIKFKRDVNYGQVVIPNLSVPEMNPIRLMIVACFGVAHGEPKCRVSELYDIWSEKF
jgi:hypothetical protein